MKFCYMAPLSLFIYLFDGHLCVTAFVYYYIPIAVNILVPSGFKE